MTKHQFHKVVTLDRVIESRPPLRADLSGPTSTHYKIKSKGNSPSYSFGRKCNDIVTSADGKNVAPFHIQPSYNADFPKPSPAAYESPAAVGNGQYCYPSAPAFSIGPVHDYKTKSKSKNTKHKNKNSKQENSKMDNSKMGNSKKEKSKIIHHNTSKKGVCPNHNQPDHEQQTRRGTLYRRVHPTIGKKMTWFSGPSACSYNVQQAEAMTQQRAPAFSMGNRIGNSGFLGVAQRSARETPGCNTYNPVGCLKISKQRYPTYRICGERKPKRHDTGPFSTL